MTLFLKNATYIDWETLAFQSTHMAVRPGVDGGADLLDRLPSAKELAPADRVLDCHHRMVTKSFGCGHHHIYSALARGMPAPPAVPQNFSQILKYIWWRVDRALDAEIIEASALAAALYCIKNGVTFIIDHHASPFAIEGSLDVIAGAFDRIGVSHLLCYEMSDRDGEGPCAEGLAETERYLKSGAQGHVGLHASFTVGDRLLQSAAALALKYGTGIHVHVAEDAADQQACLKTHRQRVLMRFKESGALDMDKSVLAHCIHLDAAEKNLLRQSAAWIVQNVESNQNNNVGLADYSRLGKRVMLGTDGMHHDMLRSAKAAFLAGQATEGIDMAGIYRRFRNIHHYIAAGGFEGDGNNNLVILNYDSPTEISPDNFLAHFVYGLDAAHVDGVISNGRLVVENRRVLTVDEADVLAFSREMGSRLWRKLSE